MEASHFNSLPPSAIFTRELIKQ